MKNKTLFCFALLLVILFGWSPVMAAEVSQGKCLQYDQEKKMITIEEYDLNFSQENPYGQSTGQTSAYDVSTALIGIKPEPGDILRIAYVIKGADRVALKVMNVSKQDLRKK
jgi:hypothetical protein